MPHQPFSDLGLHLIGDDMRLIDEAPASTPEPPKPPPDGDRTPHREIDDDAPETPPSEPAPVPVQDPPSEPGTRGPYVV